jgi:hypothetical protein
MNIDSLFWMLFPLVGIVCLAIMMPKVKRSRKSTITGLIITAAIVGGYIVWKITQGGF